MNYDNLEGPVQILCYRHQGFNISRGSGSPQYVIHDLAVIKVDTTNKPVTFLKPACLPTSESLPNKELDQLNLFFLQILNLWCIGCRPHLYKY